MDGIIIINKPLGMTSQQVVSKVKRELGIKKAGHTGTLDPMATGVLPILLDKGTKLSQYLIEHDKKYCATIFFGEKKDTGDQEGETIEYKDVPEINEDLINNVLNSFLGKQKQIPPMYSAIKVNGKKLYEYARNGETIERAERDIEIYGIKLILIEQNKVKFEVACSKGTYIRVLCEDIAERLGTVGYMSALERIQVEDFLIKDSVNLDEIKENIDKIISIESYFSKNGRIELNDKKLNQFLNGVKLEYQLNDGIYNIYDGNNKYIGIGNVKSKILKREIIL